MAQDVGMVESIAVSSHLVWLVFEGSIPTCACFHSENFFVTCISMFFHNTDHLSNSYITSTRDVSGLNCDALGTLKNQPNKMGTTPQYFPPSLHLVPFCQLCFVLVVCIRGLWKAGGWLVLGVFMCMETAVATKHSRYGLSCTYVETIECMSSAGSV